MTSNVGGSVGTGNIITSHTLTTSGSDLTSDTNGVKATMNLDAAIAYSVANNSGVTASMVGALS